MTEELITFETAVLAKEKGFVNGSDEKWCDNVEGKEPVLTNGTHSLYRPLFLNSYDNYHEFEAPTQSLLQRWLREAHNIHTNCIVEGIELPIVNYIGVVTVIDNMLTTKYISKCYPTYELALESALVHALNLI